MRTLATLCSLALVCGCSKAVWVHGGVGSDARLVVERGAAPGRYAVARVAPVEVSVLPAGSVFADHAEELAGYARSEFVRALESVALFDEVVTEQASGALEVRIEVTVDFGGRRNLSGLDAGHTSLDARVRMFEPGSTAPAVVFDAVGLGITSYDALEGPKADIRAIADRFAVELARYAARRPRSWTGRR